MENKSLMEALRVENNPLHFKRMAEDALRDNPSKLPQVQAALQQHARQQGFTLVHQWLTRFEMSQRRREAAQAVA